MAVEKRVRFKSWWLPWALVAPQLVIVLVFFFWPAAQALYYSVQQQDAFGTSVEWVGLENFERLFHELMNEPEQEQVFARMQSWLDERFAHTSRF